MDRTLIKETINKVGKQVALFGWVNTVRSHGKLSFIDLRDRSGIIQMVDTSGRKGIHTQDVLYVEGAVRQRPKNLVNPKMATGTIEIEIKKLDVLSQCRDLPFPLEGDGYDINEEVRLKYRYLDLRRGRLQKNLRLRSDFIAHARDFLFSQDFIEIETPLLTKSTPEGSRDFLVPSRLQPGKFYALPQSPQQYKQLLMVAGFERYFQIARCLRDEDLRSDRGFEHSQIDLEMSFMDRQAVMSTLEGLIIYVYENLGQKIKQKPFPVFTYQEAMQQFGSDKFDLRNENDKKEGIKAFAWVVDFPFFEKDKDGKWTFTHNPFSNPKPEYLKDLLEGKNIGGILTTQYDLVCNGLEVGGGSIRANDPSVLEAVFSVMGYSKDKIRDQFGHMLDAFTYGAPPHGGCAFGVERHLMVITGEKYLREVVAFPQTAGGKSAVMDAPNDVEDPLLDELGIQVKEQPKEEVFSRIKKYLDGKSVAYKVIEHKPVFTSQEAAQVRGTDLKSGAKAIIVMADESSPLMVVVPADKKVDFIKVAKAGRYKTVKMAGKEKVIETTGVSIGAVPPFGNLFEIPVFVDESLFENEIIAFNAGTHTKSISMKASDYQRHSTAAIGDFIQE